MTEERLNGGCLDEREAYVQWLSSTYPRSYDEADAQAYWRNGHVSALAWQQRASLSTSKQAGAEPVIAVRGVDASDGFWRSCSGCHELNEGHDTGPYSEVFKCALGNGCSECGGLGAVWDSTDYDAMADAMAQDTSVHPIAAPAPAASANAGMVMVPLEFVQGFGTLAHNYSLTAIPPDYYQGTERDAFSNAYRRCGADLAKLRDLIEAAAPAPASEAVAWQCRKRVPNNPTWSEWTSCLERDHVAIQAQSLHWGMVYQSRALCLATPSTGDSADAPVQQAGEVTEQQLIDAAFFAFAEKSVQLAGQIGTWSPTNVLTNEGRELLRRLNEVRAALKGEQPVEPEGSERGEV
jgi:hypothetical protein